MSLVNLLGCSRSFYGYKPQLQESTISLDKVSVALTFDQNAINCNDDKLNHETLCSFFLALLPSLTYQYQTTSEIDVMSFDDDKYSTILSTTLKALQTKAGWNIPQVLYFSIILMCNVYLHAYIYIYNIYIMFFITALRL